MICVEIMSNKKKDNVQKEIHETKREQKYYKGAMKIKGDERGGLKK